MKTITVAATVAVSLAGIVAANPIAEPQGFGGFFNRRPAVTVTVSVPAPNPTQSPSSAGNTKPAESPKSAGGKGPAFPFYFTSTYAVIATPDQVINGNTSAPGEPGAIGLYDYGINSDLEVICYVSINSPNAGVHQTLTLRAEHHSQGRDRGLPICCQNRDSYPSSH